MMPSYLNVSGGYQWQGSSHVASQEVAPKNRFVKNQQQHRSCQHRVSNSLQEMRSLQCNEPHRVVNIARA